MAQTRQALIFFLHKKKWEKINSFETNALKLTYLRSVSIFGQSPVSLCLRNFATNSRQNSTWAWAMTRKVEF